MQAVSIQWVKPIPKEQINKFEDRVVYNTAKFTRTMTGSSNAYPYRTGKLKATERTNAIIGNNKEYGLTAGVNYAKYVWNMKNVNWTNPSTKPQWYYNQFRSSGTLIVAGAVHTSLKEV